MKAPLALGFPFEMFDDIGEVNLGTINARFFESGIQEPAGRTDKGPPDKIFVVARLFAHEHYFRAAWALAENGLGSGFPEWTGVALGGGLAEGIEFCGEQSGGGFKGWISRFWHGGQYAASRRLARSDGRVGWWVFPLAKQKWNSIFQAFLIRRLPPFEANVRKRLVKAPRIYWRDPGLLHALLRLRTDDDLFAQPWVGASWEGFVIEQIESVRRSRGEEFDAYFFRTHDGHEADLVLDHGREREVIDIKLTSGFAVGQTELGAPVSLPASFPVL